MRQDFKVSGTRGDVLMGLYGAGGFGREVMPILKGQVSDEWHMIEQIVETCFIETVPSSKLVGSEKVYSESEFRNLDFRTKFFNVAIADPRARKEISDRMVANGLIPLSIKSDTSVVYEGSKLGVGSILCPLSIITANVIVGDFFHLNPYAYIAHDCEIGNYVTFAWAAKCSGNVSIEDGVFVGAGAVIKQGSRGKKLFIGEGATIGMGAVVTKDVRPHTTVVGNPAREIPSKKIL
jgi:sugar O-acyltransferase (sialic acid O-acetyltransferase NeuD family)